MLSVFGGAGSFGAAVVFGVVLAGGTGVLGRFWCWGGVLGLGGGWRVG